MANSKLSNDDSGDKYVRTYDAERFLTEEEKEIRMVLVGRTGSGISATGNSILERVCFHSDLSVSSVSKTCCIGTTERDGKVVKVVDTPGFFGNILTFDEIKHEILNCFTLISPGPHVIVYVLRIGRVTNEEIKGVKRFLEIFGGHPLQYTILLFTGVDDLEWKQMSNEEYLNNTSFCLQELVKSCNRRCVFFNNRLSSSKISNNQCNEFFKIVEKMLKDNDLGKQPYYTNHIITQIAEDEYPSVENELAEPQCIPSNINSIVGVSSVLATGIACACVGNPSLLPFVGAGILGFGVTKYFKDYRQKNDEICKVLEKIKEESIMQCTIS